MPVFEYRGLTPAGKQVKGLLEADSSRSLRQQLKRSGVFLTDVLAERESTPARPRQNGTTVAQPFTTCVNSLPLDVRFNFTSTCQRPGIGLSTSSVWSATAVPLTVCGVVADFATLPVGSTR